MAGEINKLIPLYGELNRIYNDWITNYAFSFDKQKFITDFYRQHNDTKAFESAILELVLDKQKEQYTLILNSLKIEIEKNIRAYETKPLNDDIIKRVCFHYADRRNSIIKDQLEITTKLHKPLNDAYHRYDFIGFENIRMKKKYWLKRNMNAARLNTTRKRKNWINSMNCKSKTGKRLFNIQKTFPVMFTA